MNETNTLRTILITSFNSFVSKNVLNAGVLDLLLAENDIRIVLLVPQEKTDFFKEQCPSERLKVEGIDTEKVLSPFLEKCVRTIAWHCMDSHYMWYKRVEKRDAKHTFLAWIEYYIVSAVVWLWSNLPFVPNLLRIIERKFVKNDTIANILTSYDPSLVFSTDIFDPRDSIFVRESMRRGIKTMGMVRSWDNCFSKGLMRTFPEQLLVNNLNIKAEANEIHGMPFNKIEAVGLPQFDKFVTEKRMGREEFFDSIGADPAKELVLFAPGGSILSDTDWQIYEIMARAREEGKFKKPFTIYVRNHPAHPADFSKARIREGDIVATPGQVFKEMGMKETELTRADSKFLADLLRHSSVVMWIATTLPLDAVVFDRPLISVDFDGWEDKRYTESVKRYHNEGQMVKLFKTGGVALAKDEDDLINKVNAYLENPKLDKEGRGKIVEEQLYKLDGQSSERVASAVLQMLRN
jgi:hypothetical protein